MRRSQWLVFGSSLVMAVACVWLFDSQWTSAVAQTGASSKSKLKTGTSKAKSAAETKELEVRAEKNLDTFVSETIKIAEDFERAGRFEEAQEQLRAVSKLKPELPGLKEKIEKLNDSLFESNELEVEQDAKESWKAQVLVTKDKPIRIDAVGEYTIMMSIKTDANGLSVKDAKTDMVAGVRCGALMGIVVPIPESGSTKASSRNDRERVGTPFEIGTSKEFTPKEDGILLLNLNLPSGHKSVGKVRVRVSGHIKMLPKELRS